MRRRRRLGRQPRRRRLRRWMRPAWPNRHRRQPRRQYGAARRSVDIRLDYPRGRLACGHRATRAEEGARDQRQGFRRAGREWAEKAKADPSLRFDDAIVREKAFAAPQVASSWRSTRPGARLRYLREALPRALPGAQFRADRLPEESGGLHGLPYLRMAVPGFRDLRFHRAREAVTA